MNLSFLNRRKNIWLAGLLFVVAIVVTTNGAIGLRASLTPSLDEEAIIELVEKSLPSVVSIAATKKDETTGKTSILYRGSGFVVSADGLLLTNKHVVRQVDLVYRVTFGDGRKYTAKVLGRDPLNDLALLQIPGNNFTSLPLGDSKKVRIGQTALAIGNSLGRYSNSVTRGIISGKGRFLSANDDITGDTENLENVFQTDAAINRGNSGGPLLNSRGEAVGINTAIEEQGRGVGFAIPINEAKKIIASYKKNGKIIRPFLGVRYLTVNAELQEKENLRYDYGAFVSSGTDTSLPAVVPNTPAFKAGLKEGDIILSINNILIRRNNTLRKIITSFEPGEEVYLQVARGNKVLAITVILDELPSL